MPDAVDGGGAPLRPDGPPGWPGPRSGWQPAQAPMGVPPAAPAGPPQSVSSGAPGRLTFGQQPPALPPPPSPMPPRMPEVGVRPPQNVAAMPEPTGGQPLRPEVAPGTTPGDPPSERPPEQDWAEPMVAGDWLDRICPYLLSEDGTYRSSEPDPGHRCTAQDPASTLPIAFQERFCLSERHVRCEMYKVARSARSAALGQEGIPVDQLRTGRFKPSVRSVPLAFGPAKGAQGTNGARSRRPVIVAAIAIGGLAVLIFALVLLLSGGRGPGSNPGASASPVSEAAASAVPERSGTATSAAEASGDLASEATLGTSPEAPASPIASVAAPAAEMLVEYEVQEGEALIAIAEAFGTSRRAILVANPDIVDQQPHTKPGDIIIVPAAGMTVEEIEAMPGFRRFVE